MAMSSLHRWVILALVVTLFAGKVFALRVILVNDADWRSAYIVGYYAAKKGYGFMAIDSEATGREVIPYLLSKSDDIVIYRGPNPVFKNYVAYLKAQGFTHVQVVSFKSPYDLMYSLPQQWGIHLTGAVLVSDSGGEWVLSAGPLAYASNSYLLLLNNRTKARAVSFVKSHNLSPVYVVGYPGKSVRDALPNARIIATGNRAEDAVEVAKELRKFVSYSQVLVMSGMYLYLPSRPTDPPIWTGSRGKNPILIAYVNKLPKATLDFLKQDFVKAIVFVGPELDQQWSNVHQMFPDKRVLSLFAVGYVHVPTRRPGQPYPLPVMFLPSADVSVSLESAKVLPDGRMFLKLRNLGSSAGYAMPTDIVLKCQNGFHAEITPQKAFFVDAKDSTIAEYDLNQTVPLGACTLSVTGVYGADKDNMELDFNAVVPVEVQGINDPSKISVERIVYSPRLQHIIVYVKNTGSVPTYVTVYIDHLLIDGIPHIVKTRQGMVMPGAEAKLYARVYLTDADFLDNPTVHYTARFGKDAGLPVHIITGTLPLEKETLQDVVLDWLSQNYLLVSAALVLIIVMLLVLRRR